MRIVDHQRKFIGDMYHLDTALYFGIFEGFDDILTGYLKVTADGNRSQGIVDAEFTRQIGRASV